MKIVLLNRDYNIVHEFEDVKPGKRATKPEHWILEYRGKHYVHHDAQTNEDEFIHTYHEAEVLSLNVTLGGA